MMRDLRFTDELASINMLYIPIYNKIDQILYRLSKRNVLKSRLCWCILSYPTAKEGRVFRVYICVYI